MNPFYNALTGQLEHQALAKLPIPKTINHQTLPSWFEVTDLACAAMALAWGALHRYAKAGDAGTLDVRLANLWFGFTLQPMGWQIPNAWDNIAGDYQTCDGWIRLHTNAAHHKAVALKVLDCPPESKAVERAVSQFKKLELEQLIVDQGGCAAAMNSMEEWHAHPVGQAVLSGPLLHWQCSKNKQTPKRQSNSVRKPLKGMKVLDLTRILAGPVATRFLAGFGANVLRIDPLGWHEPSLEQEITLGKRCARLDLKSDAGRKVFEQLIRDADVIVHGYRSTALANLGYTAARLTELNEQLIDISLNAYGWANPWQQRRGFDSLVQMSCGIAAYGMQKSKTERPTPLPVQALDHVTGYIMAAATIQALELRRDYGIVSSVKTSLAATAQLLMSQPRQSLSTAMSKANDGDFEPKIETTSWGDAKRVRFPLTSKSIQADWPNGAVSLGSSAPDW